MIATAEKAGVQLVVGHSHSFDAPYLKTAELIRGGEMGQVRMIHTVNYTDFLYRPRRPEELDTARGGGVVYSQAAHQVDVVRLLAGGEVTQVSAQTGSWDPARPTEGAYCALLKFNNGVFASLTYSGYAHFEGDEFKNWTGELGQARAPDQYGRARAALRQVRSAGEETALKNKRAYGDGMGLADARHQDTAHNHFGLVLVSCDRADLRPTPTGILVYGDSAQRLIPLPPPDIPRREVIDELVLAIRKGTLPLHSGESGMATVQVCLAILESARTGTMVTL
jgi:phthalate 4,5-cis-dihydrodiol dehydrogenase